MRKKISKKRSVAKKTKGPRYTCEACGLAVTVDETCGCVDTCDIVCCGEQMKKK